MWVFPNYIPLQYNCNSKCYWFPTNQLPYLTVWQEQSEKCQSSEEKRKKCFSSVICLPLELASGMMVLYMNHAQHHARVGALNILIVVSNLAYKTSAEYIKIEIIAEKKNYIESQSGKKKTRCRESKKKLHREKEWRGFATDLHIKDTHSPQYIPERADGEKWS